MLRCISLFALALATSAIACLAQAGDSTPAAATAKTSVPNLIRFSGTVASEGGKLEPGELTTTFLIYKDKQGGEPLWAESQVVSLDAARHYEVHLGATSPDGLPNDLFSSGEARWLEVQVAGHKPEPRTLLVSVPYAMKSANADTLGGLPASAFMLAGTKAAETPAGIASPEASATAVTTTGGTAGYLPVYSGATAVDDSILFQSGAKVGIGTNVPAATLDVNGSVAARGAVVLEGTGAATTAIGRNSQPLDFAASVYNSAMKTAVAPMFSLQAEPFANNSATPAGTLNLLYGSGTAPTETGLSISSKGLIKFAAGQTFSGAGTITGVTTTSPLTGSGTTGSIALGLNLTALETTFDTKYPQLAAASKFTAPVTFGVPVTFAPTQTFPGTGKGTITGVTTTSPLAGSGTTGSVALSLNLTALETTLNAKYPQLAVANKFTAPVAFSVPVTFAATQTFPGAGKGTITGVTTTSPLTGSGTAGSVALGLNLTALETTLNAKYPQLAVASKFTAPVVFSVPVTFAATQTFPGIAGGGTITGVTTTSPLTGSGTKGSIALGLNVTALETTLNFSYARLGAPNKFTAPITFATGQSFPGAGTITAVTAGTGLIGGGTSGSIKLSLDPAAIPTLSGSPVFSSSKDGVQGVTAGTVLDTAGVEGVAGTASGAAMGIAGVWGDAYAHVGVLGTSHQYSGVQGVSTTSYGVQGSSTSNTGVLGTSTSGTGVSGLSTTNSGVAGYTPGSTINTAGVNGKAGATSGIVSIVAGVWGDSYQQVGVEGTSAQSIGVYGQSTVYNGVQGVSNTAVGVSGLSTSGTGMAGSSNTGAGMVGYTAGSALNTGGVIGIAGVRTTFSGISGIWGDAANHVGVFGSSNIYAGVQGSSVSAPGVQGNSTSGNGVHGVSNSTSGIFGETSSTSGGDAALYGLSHNNAIGVFGFSPKFGVIGEAAGNSGTGAMASTFINGPAAVWGDTSTAGYAVAGTTDNGVAGEFMNNSYSQSALYVVNNNSFGGSHVADFSGTSGGCSFFGNGDVLCTGKVSSAAISKDGEKAVKTYSVQSAENWYEDAGSGQLLNGVVHIHLDPTFGETVNTDVEYHVFLTPGGDSEGLYVTNKTADGFDVHEQHGGHSNIAFDYRIMAKRAGHEKERLEDVTEQVKKGAGMRAKMIAEAAAKRSDEGTGNKE